jgi:HPt (histidine-containing phosphotransfer) domain-containing protein
MPDERNKTIAAAPLVIDLSTIDELAEGDPAVEADLIAMFVRHTAEGIAQVRAAIGADQLDEAARVAHKCIGFTATIGITVLVPTLRELERAIRDQQREVATRLLAQWQREFDHIREALQARIRPPGTV